MNGRWAMQVPIIVASRTGQSTGQSTGAIYQAVVLVYSTAAFNTRHAPKSANQAAFYAAVGLLKADNKSSARSHPLHLLHVQAVIHCTTDHEQVVAKPIQIHDHGIRYGGYLVIHRRVFCRFACLATR